MNIILNRDYTLRTTKMKEETEYGLSDIDIFIPNSFNSYNCFLCLINNIGLTDIVPIEFVENSSSYKKYKISYSNPIRINSGETKIKIILVDSENHSVIISAGNVLCNLDIENYKIGHQMTVISDTNSSIQNMYNKIQELTKMNIDIYEKIVEASKL